MNYRGFSYKSIVGCILFFGMAFYSYAPTNFLDHNSLLQRSGIIDEVQLIYERVSYKRSTSIRSKLVIVLMTDNTEYAIFENIGNSTLNLKYEELKRKLKKARKTNIWIKKNESEKVNPEVFQIANDSDEILYTFDEAKSNAKFGFWMCIFFGVFIPLVDVIVRSINSDQNSKYFFTFTKVKVFLLRILGPLIAIFFGWLSYSIYKSDPSFNPLTIIFGLISIGFVYGTVLFEIDLKK
ncbi:MAG: hypothetical protein AB8F74_20850 [Saprospiraceae bacterium]